MLPYLILELEMGCSSWNWQAKHGFSNLTGIDYSKAAVELTINILKEEGLKFFKIQVVDFLNPSAELKGFDVCIDKGTFDAISLRPEDREEAKKCYVNSLKTVMQPGGFFIITSCTWTKEQLLQIFTPGTLTYWHIS
uniref:EEF1A lysine methyltransferase 2 n=1 Tax=Cyprinus carpio TaxID=7962 RepID=A0A8C1WIM1_CYPCA